MKQPHRLFMQSTAAIASTVGTVPSITISMEQQHTAQQPTAMPEAIAIAATIKKRNPLCLLRSPNSQCLWTLGNLCNQNNARKTELHLYKKLVQLYICKFTHLYLLCPSRTRKSTRYRTWTSSMSFSHINSEHFCLLFRRIYMVKNYRKAVMR